MEVVEEAVEVVLADSVSFPCEWSLHAEEVTLSVSEH